MSEHMWYERSKWLNTKNYKLCETNQKQQCPHHTEVRIEHWLIHTNPNLKDKLLKISNSNDAYYSGEASAGLRSTHAIDKM